MQTGNQHQGTPARRRVEAAERVVSRAFTLVELLVVISVIATLMGMLAQSLRNAREQARVVVCCAHTAAIGRAAASYSSEMRQWLCGSPGTSGSVMFSDEQIESTDEDIATDPSQIWDYAGALGPTYMNRSLPANRAERMRTLVEDGFACPSNSYFADPIQGSTEEVGPIGSFDRQPMASFNTIRNFLMWPRTMVDRDPSQPWGPIAPFPQASFDTIGGRTLRPKNYKPHIDRITNPAGKVYLADGNRYTDGEGNITYDVEWDAEAGGAFCNGGPTLPLTHGTNPHVLSSYQIDMSIGKIGYRHISAGDRGIVANFFDGHSTFVSEPESREPDYWWPRGTVIPFSELNESSLKCVTGRLRPDYSYRVGR